MMTASTYRDDNLGFDQEDIAILQALLLTPRQGPSYPMMPSDTKGYLTSIMPTSLLDPEPTIVKTPAAPPLVRRGGRRHHDAAKYWKNVAATTSKVGQKKRKLVENTTSQGPKRPASRQPVRKGQTTYEGYKQMTPTQCLQRIQCSFQLVSTFKQMFQRKQEDLYRTIQDWQVFVVQSPTVNARNTYFMMEKTLSSSHLYGQNVQDLMHQTWQCWTDEKKLGALFPSKQISLKILQRFNGDGIIVCQDKQVQGGQIQRSIYMLFRIETKQGFTICAHSLDKQYDHTSPGIIQWRQEVLYWISFQNVSASSNTIRVEYGGILEEPVVGSTSSTSTFPLTKELDFNIASMLAWEQFVIVKSINNK